MRIFLLPLVFVFFFNYAKSQVVFCPPGAEWHYLFSEAWAFPWSKVNETIKYSGFTIQNGDTIKKLWHKNFFIENNNYSLITGYTDIKQKGDTIFMRNNWTNYNWQILYNFAAQANQFWVNTFTNSTTYTTSVVAVNTVIVGTRTVKQLTVNYQGNISGQSFTDTGFITEYFGSNVFLFNYDSHMITDGDHWEEFLCYKDDQIGLQQFSPKGCYYSNTLGLFEKSQTNKLVSVYPNPTSNFLTINFQNANGIENYEIKLLDILGRSQIEPGNKIQDLRETRLDLSLLPKGIYFLQIWDKGKLVVSEKVMKD